MKARMFGSRGSHIPLEKERQLVINERTVIIDSRDPSFILVEEGYVVLPLVTEGKTEEEIEKAARIKAAGPELYERCEKVVVEIRALAGVAGAGYGETMEKITWHLRKLQLRLENDIATADGRAK